MDDLEQVVSQFFQDSVVFFPTAHNLDNNTPVANQSFREVLSISGVHDFETQGLGKEQFGVELPFALLTAGGTGEPLWSDTRISLHRAKGTRCERRFWVYGLKGSVQPGDKLAFCFDRNRGSMAIDLSQFHKADSLRRVLQHRLGEPTDAVVDPDESPSIGRATYRVQRIVRDSALTRKVKSLYDFSCQICNERIVGASGVPYAEGAHIWPLSAGGPDALANILCLCPNHHVLLDTGAVLISDEHVARYRGSGRVLGSLTSHPSHAIDLNCVRKQRALFEQD